MKPKKARHPAKPNPPAAVASKTGVAGSPSELRAHRGHYVSLAIVCLAIIGFWVWSAEPGGLDSSDSHPEKAYYNLLVEGFQSGQLNLKTEVPPGLVALQDPYDSKSSLQFRWYDGHPLLDLSYYHGKFYLYFGVTPAVVLFWPYAAVTGHYLSQKDAVLIFCVVGFLAGVGMLYGLWRRCFAEVSFGVVLAGAVALGLAAGLPMLLSRSEVYEVAISCGFAFVMLALTAVWGALASPQRQARWLAAGSLAFGLAVGARPDLLFGAGILLVPVIMAWRGRQRVGGLVLAAVVPIVLVGLGLMYYNELRFGSPLEFGQLYQFGFKQNGVRHFSLGYLWFNFRMYFLEPVRLSSVFPFVHGISVPPFPAGHGAVEFAFGILMGIPLVWLGLATPLAWRDRPAETRLVLRGLTGAIGWVGASSALLLCLYYWVADRYEVEFLPALILLAVVGIFGLERTLAGQWRQLTRFGWVLLLTLSVGFNLIHAVQRHAMAHNELGTVYDYLNQDDQAIQQYQQAIRLMPDYEEPHYSLGCILDKQGQIDGAIHEFQEAIRLKPDYADAYNDLGNALSKKGREDEAFQQYQEALRLQPDDSRALNNYGVHFLNNGQVDKAIPPLREAVRLQPDYTDAHYNLSLALGKQGRLDEAISQFQETLLLEPDYVEAHEGLGIAFLKTGRLDEAISQFQAALRLQPDDASAQNNLSIALQMKNAPADH